MKYFYLYIFILICIIIVVSCLNTFIFSESRYIEPFYNANKMFLLLGDSILNNSSYVTNGKSVNHLLIERTNGNTICFAEDNSKIVDIYNQLKQIPKNFNSNKTIIFLSIGGNDILTHYDDKEGDTSNYSILETFFTAYKKVVQYIRDKLPNSQIILLDIYYPENLRYKQYHDIISEWNNKIYVYANDPKNGINSVFKISSILTQPDDFTFAIEPSANGSIKMVDAMLNNY